MLPMLTGTSDLSPVRLSLSIRSLTISSFVLAASLLSPSIAFSQESALPEAPSIAGQTSDVELKTPKTESKTFVSDGSPLSIEHLGITIKPPQGWEVSTNTGSLSIVMREPKKPVTDYSKPIFQRNITVAAIYQASPIDEKRALELQEQLTKSFGADSLVSNFQIIEHKFFNYKGVNDGLVVYSSLNIGEFPMMQMHVLVSGQDKQFLLTYTDLADAFTDAHNPNFEQAWNSMVSIDVTGQAPLRRDQLLRYGAMGGGVLLLLLVIGILRYRAKRRDYRSEGDALDDSLYSGELDSGFTPSMIATLHGTWNLSRNASGAGKDGEDEIEFAADAPHTKQTSYVSNY